MDVLLTTQEAAARAGVGTTAIKRWADSGILPCVRTAGGHRRFRARDVDGLLRDQAAQRRDQGAQPGESEPEDSEASEVRAWVDALIAESNPYSTQGRLLQERARLGSWFKVATFIGDVLSEIGLRWERGALTVLEEHLVSERLSRALSRALESIVVAEDAPSALLACAEGEDHTLGLACAELCLREAGWNTSWSGRATPAEEIVAAIEGGFCDMVAASASAHARDRLGLQRWVSRIAEACSRRGIPLVLGGQGAWPDAPTHGERFETFEEFRDYLIGLPSSGARP